MSTTALPEQLSDAAREFASREHALLIGGEWASAAEGSTFETLDPGSGRVITTVAEAGPADVDRAVAAAREAFEHGRWGSLAAAERARLIYRLADIVEAAGEELAQLESLDNGKPVKLAGIVDVASTAAQLRHFAGWPERAAVDNFLEDHVAVGILFEGGDGLDALEVADVVVQVSGDDQVTPAGEGEHVAVAQRVFLIELRAGVEGMCEAVEEHNPP